LHGKSPLTFHCRTFETFTLSFTKDSEAHDVFESVKELTVASAKLCSVFLLENAHVVAASVTQLYAFYYTPNPPLSSSIGWSIYSPREEFGRMGVGARTKAWRFTDINKDYTVR
jgi:myotubularin-related protein 6/7/8